MRKKVIAGMAVLSLCAGMLMSTTAYALENASENDGQTESVSQQEGEENDSQTVSDGETKQYLPEENSQGITEGNQTEGSLEAESHENPSDTSVIEEPTPAGEDLTETEPKETILESEVSSQDVTPANEQTQNYVLGDVDSDGEITPRDRIILSRYLDNWVGYEEKVTFAASDVNKDGQINDNDLEILRGFLLGENESLNELKSE